MLTLSDIPLVNACFNTLSTALLLAGYAAIRRGNQNLHRNCMAGALLSSALFLAGYLYYHFHAGRTVFRDPAWFRPWYLALLLTHTVLAVAIVPLILMTVIRAVKGQFEAHKKVARITFPMWLYVSVTGVVIYLLLYQIFPQK